MTDDADKRVLTPAERSYIGEYRSGGVDSMAGLLLLADGTFCFSFMGGSLDHLAAGRWQSDPSGTGIRLSEVRPDTPAIVAWARRVDASTTAGTAPSGEPSPQVAFAFHGYSLSNAPDPVFAVSATDAPTPSSFRPVFPPDMPSWAERYPLPPIDSDEARFLFLGYVQPPESADAGPRLHVWQYEVGRSNDIVIAFDMMQAAPRMDLSAVLIEDVLHLDGNEFGTRQPMPEELARQARAQCVEPRLTPAVGVRGDEVRGRDQGEGEVEAEDDESDRHPLPPLRALQFDAGAIQGAPWIPRE